MMSNDHGGGGGGSSSSTTRTAAAAVADLISLAGTNPKSAAIGTRSGSTSGTNGRRWPAGPCTCPLRQAWGSLDALLGRLRAAYEENGGAPEANPFANGAIRVYLREVLDSQAKARGIPYWKKKKRKKPNEGIGSSFHPMQSSAP